MVEKWWRKSRETRMCDEKKVRRIMGVSASRGMVSPGPPQPLPWEWSMWVIDSTAPNPIHPTAVQHNTHLSAENCAFAFSTHPLHFIALPERIEHRTATKIALQFFFWATGHWNYFWNLLQSLAVYCDTRQTSDTREKSNTGLDLGFWCHCTAKNITGIVSKIVKEIDGIPVYWCIMDSFKINQTDC